MKYRIKKYIKLDGSVEYTTEYKKNFFRWVHVNWRYNGRFSDVPMKYSTIEEALGSIDFHYLLFTNSTIKSIEIEYITKNQ